jgi:hypothetical protein
MALSRTTSPIQARIQRILRCLIGIKLRKFIRAAEWQMVSFGEVRKEVLEYGRRKGEFGLVPEFSLHIFCGWRIMKRNSIISGRLDLDFKASDEPGVLAKTDLCLWDWRTRQLKQAGISGLTVRKVVVDHLYGIHLGLEKGYSIDVFPMGSSRRKTTEHWRFFTWDHQKRPLVVSNYEIQLPD